MEETGPDKRPGKLLSLYLPATLGVLTAALITVDCDCEITFSRALMQVTVGAVVGFAFWWIAAMVCFHGYHFVLALFRHPN